MADQSAPPKARKKAKTAAKTPVQIADAKPAAKSTTKVAAMAAPKPSTPTKPKAKPRATSRPAAPKPADAGPAPQVVQHQDLALLLTSENAAALERLSTNLARAALTAQGALAGAALKQAENPGALNPDPFNAAPAMSEVIGKLAAQPDRLFKAQADLLARYMDLWQSAAKRMTDGEKTAPVVTPAAGDRRFNDADWDANPMFDVIKQSYLLSANWLNELVGQVEDVEPQTKRRAEFFMKFMTDALAPSNFLMSNPVALRQVVETGGESLVRGMDNFAADLERGGGSLQISQSDPSKFEVGVNVASTPGKVVFQNQLIQLLQFEPFTEQVHEIPLVIFPPWINKYYILDMRPDNSMIRWLSQQGFTVFVVSWVNPDASMAEQTFEDYMTGAVYPAIEAALKQTGAAKVNAVGYCIAGTLLSCTLAHMASKGDDRVASATFFAAQQDFSDAGDLALFTEEDWLRAIEVRMDEAGGVLPGRVMSDTFNSLRANDLIWSFFVGNYLMGKEPKPFDLLFWNSDQTRMPKALHMFYLRRFYNDNALAKGELVLGGEKLDLGAVKTPIFAQSAKEDHIAPYRSVYRGLKLFGGPKSFIVAGSGHIAGVINAPAAAKYQYWTNAKLEDDADGWFADAKEHPGSWWPHWVEWLVPKSGPMVAARDPAKGPLKPIEDAPGSFVRVKS